MGADCSLGPDSLAGKHILLGVTGGISAYKTPALVRLLQSCGAEVRVCMTRHACKFVAPLTLQALSGHFVLIEQFPPQRGDGMDHIHYARWADVLLIAPATANFIAKVAHGLADDLLTTMCLASDGLRVIAPAMNRVMWSQGVVGNNIQSIEKSGWQVLPVGSGEQACGEVGEGRMLEPEDITRYLVASHKSPVMGLQGRRVLITAGPTRESIDPVRFISNHSSGKMGYALARTAQMLGAEVVLVSGPVSIEPPQGCALVRVETCAQMYAEVMQRHSWCDILVACAAVADYRPVTCSSTKVKKDQQQYQVELERTPDILADFSLSKKEGQYVVGFAAETDKLLEYARNKLERKKMDMVVANIVGQSDTGFHADKNSVTIITSDGVEKPLAKGHKCSIAREIMGEIAHRVPRVSR